VHSHQKRFIYNALLLKGRSMEEEFSTAQSSKAGRSTKNGVHPSIDKSLRTMLLAVLFQVSWPTRLTAQQLIEQLPLYGDSPKRALYRDIETLTNIYVRYLPEPGDANIAEWCTEQQRLNRLAISYDRQSGTFGLEQSFFSLDISEDEARAFVALEESFTPGTPYAEAVQHLLKRWAWLFTVKSHQLVQQKRKRRAQPLLLPLSPVADYSQHGSTILDLDRALEQSTYVSFAYTPLSQSWDAEPIQHEHIEPYELEYRDGHWYFTAYLFDLNNFVDYRVDRIRPGSVVPSKDLFLPGNRQRPGVKIRYWVSPMLARHSSLSARLREQKVEMLENEQGARVEGYAKSVWWARRLLLGYGEQVKALEPEELVRMMRETVKAMSRLYEEEGK
jgi:predicted DNA-binding transcriptional regulator YafY